MYVRHFLTLPPFLSSPLPLFFLKFCRHFVIHRYHPFLYHSRVFWVLIIVQVASQLLQYVNSKKASTPSSPFSSSYNNAYGAYPSHYNPQSYSQPTYNQAYFQPPPPPYNPQSYANPSNVPMMTPSNSNSSHYSGYTNYYNNNSSSARPPSTHQAYPPANNHQHLGGSYGSSGEGLRILGDYLNTCLAHLQSAVVSYSHPLFFFSLSLPPQPPLSIFSRLRHAFAYTHLPTWNTSIHDLWYINFIYGNPV